MTLHRLIYFSRPVVNGPEDINEILKASYRNNDAQAISGILLFTCDWYLQVIEGISERLTNAFLIIGHDSRHKDVQLSSFKQIDERAFPEWGMHYVSHSPESLQKYHHFFAARRFNPSEMSPATLEKFALSATIGHL